MKGYLLIINIFFSLSVFAADLPSKQISLEVKQAGVRDVIESMLIASGLKYEIDVSVTNKSKVSIEAKDIKWNEVFHEISAQSSLSYYFDKDGKLYIKKM